MNSKIKISIKNPTGLPRKTPFINLTIPKINIEIRK